METWLTSVLRLVIQYDMLSWLIDSAEGEEREVRSLVLRLLVLGFAAIHTSTMVSVTSIQSGQSC